MKNADVRPSIQMINTELNYHQIPLIIYIQ